MPRPPIEIEVEELEQLQRDMEKAARELPPGLERKMGRATLLVEREAKQRASGRPGPMVQTGRLRASITPEVKKLHGEVRGIVGSNVVYAPYVEFGTKRAQAYPYLRPALEAKEEAVVKELEGVLDDVKMTVERRRI